MLDGTGGIGAGTSGKGSASSSSARVDGGAYVPLGGGDERVAVGEEGVEMLEDEEDESAAGEIVPPPGVLLPLPPSNESRKVAMFGVVVVAPKETSAGGATLSSSFSGISRNLKGIGCFLHLTREDDLAPDCALESMAAKSKRR